MKNYAFLGLILISGYSILTLGMIYPGQINAQQEAQNITNIKTNFTEQFQTNFTELFHAKFSRNVLNTEVDEQLQRDNLDFSKNVQAAVEYECPTTVLISGHLITDTDLIFNAFLFQGTDLLKNQYGFKIQDVFTSGEGSKGNPTKVYILMTK